MDMINVEAAFVILSNATDPELASALQQNAGLRRRIQRILELGPPPHNAGNAPLFQRQAQQRPTQQVPQGWPDGPGPVMSTAPSAPAAQFGGAPAQHSSERNWANLSETQSEQDTGTAWQHQDPWDEPAQHSSDPWEAPQSSQSHQAPQSKGYQSKGSPSRGGRSNAKRQVRQRRLDTAEPFAL